MKRMFPRVALVTLLTALAGCNRVVVGVNHAPPPPVVQVTEATPANASTFVEAVATLEGATSREIRSPVAGYVIKQAYQEGALVREGDLLFEIDTSREHAQPGTATASIKITSPLAGVASRAIPGVGDSINPSMTLTTVSSVDEIAAQFELPEKIYQDHQAWFTKVLALKEEGRPENISLVNDEGGVYRQAGRLDGFKQVLAASGGMVASALFPNPDHILKPGQYAKIRIAIDTDAGAVLVPQRCVSRLSDADNVIIVKPDNTVEVRTVTLGDMSGPSWIITGGITSGERVVVEGGQRCVAGETVTPEPYVEPAPEPPATHAPPQ